MAETIRIGDEGTVFTVTLQDNGSTLDPTGAETTEIKFKKPSGTVATVTASLSGTDLQWTSTAGFFNESGDWYFWGYIEDDGVGKWSSAPERLIVKAAGVP